jgi:hypothetical protein
MRHKITISKDSFKSAESRWGFIQVLLTSSSFFITLPLASYAIYVQFTGGKVMSPPVWFWLILGFGVFIGLFSVFISVVWFWDSIAVRNKRGRKGKTTKI